MADIAILVAEEYERRTRKSRKHVGGGAEEATGTTSTTTVEVSGGATAALAEKLKGMNWVKKAEEVFKDLEPKSQMGVAAFAGLFSA